MPASLTFILDGQTATPKDLTKFGIRVDFTAGSTKALSVTEVTFEGADYDRIYAYRKAGCTGGVGILEAMPLQVYLNPGNILFVNGGLDLTKAKWGCDSVTASIRSRQSLDFLNDRADSFRFEYLYSEIKSITDADFIPVWYQVGRYPKVIETVIAAMNVYILVKELITLIKEIIDCIGAIVGGLTGIAEAVINAIALIIYVIAIVIALVKTIQTLIDLLFPFVYYHHGMYVRKQIDVGCNYLGLGFSSSILDQYPKLAIEPTKNTEGKKTGLQLKEVGFYEGSLGDLLRLMIQTFSAELRVINGVVYLEQYPFFQALSTFVIPKQKAETTTNASEIASNFYLRYQFDNTDLWSYANKTGFSVQVVREPIIINDKSNILLKNRDEVQIPLCLPNVKIKQTRFEEIMGDIYNAIQSFVAVIKKGIAKLKKKIKGAGGGTPAALPFIPKTGGVGTISQDTHFNSIAKVLLTDGSGKTDPLTNQTLSALELYKNWHSIKSPVPGAGKVCNQWVNYREIEMPMCMPDFLSLCENNYATYADIPAKPARLLTLEWLVYEDTGKLDFDVNDIYTCNLKETIIVDGLK